MSLRAYLINTSLHSLAALALSAKAQMHAPEPPRPQFEMRADIDDGVTIMQRFCTILSGCNIAVPQWGRWMVEQQQ